MSLNKIETLQPDQFDPNSHFYQKVINSHIHPLVRAFFRIANNPSMLVNRYCHLHPEADREFLQKLLQYTPKYFHWAGADLFPVATNQGVRRMVIIETNSCPSGQKSFPLIDDGNEMGGYRTVIEECFLPLVKKRRFQEGKLAVLFDKNEMESRGYASTIAELSGEDVYLINFKNNSENKHLKWKNGILHVIIDKEEIPIRAVFKYVTQKPWNRVPIKSKTLIFNNILACLAGGRNKLMASKAYDFFNATNRDKGFKINTPVTKWDIEKEEVPLWVERMGGVAVVKVPYSNAGQGVFTITSQKELDEFMEKNFDYDLFIVQSLIGNYTWSSTLEDNKYFHIGTIPDKKNNIFVADLRMMICRGTKGFKPLAIYARRAKDPLAASLTEGQDSWSMLGTNLSIKKGDNQWDTDTSRLLLMDHKDFHKLGIGVDDLIEGFVQTLMATVAIDQMANRLVTSKGKFRRKLFLSLNPDEQLANEIMEEAP